MKRLLALLLAFSAASLVAAWVLVMGRPSEQEPRPTVRQWVYDLDSEPWAIPPPM